MIKLVFAIIIQIGEFAFRGEARESEERFWLMGWPFSLGFVRKQRIERCRYMEVLGIVDINPLNTSIDTIDDTESQKGAKRSR